MQYYLDPEGFMTVVETAEEEKTVQALNYTPATEQQIAKYKEFKEAQGTVGTAKSFALGAFSGATLGMGPLVAEKTGLLEPETMRLYKEANPDAYLTGDITGAVAPTLLSGGAGIAAKATGEVAKRSITRQIASGIGKTISHAPSGQLSRALQVAENKVVEKVAKNFAGESALNTLARSAPKVASAVVEGAAHGGGLEITESVLGDRDINVDNLLASMGTGALFSSAIPVATGVGASAVKGLTNKAKEPLSRAYSSLKNSFDSNPDLSNAVKKKTSTFGPLFNSVYKAVTSGNDDFTRGVAKPFSHSGKQTRQVLNLSAEELSELAGKTSEDLANDLTEAISEIHKARKKIALDDSIELKDLPKYLNAKIFGQEISKYDVIPVAAYGDYSTVIIPLRSMGGDAATVSEKYFKRISSEMSDYVKELDSIASTIKETSKARHMPGAFANVSAEELAAHMKRQSMGDTVDNLIDAITTFTKFSPTTTELGKSLLKKVAGLSPESVEQLMTRGVSVNQKFTAKSHTLGQELIAELNKLAKKVAPENASQLDNYVSALNNRLKNPAYYGPQAEVIQNIFNSAYLWKQFSDEVGDKLTTNGKFDPNKIRELLTKDDIDLLDNYLLATDSYAKTIEDIAGLRIQSIDQLKKNVKLHGDVALKEHLEGLQKSRAGSMLKDLALAGLTGAFLSPTVGVGAAAFSFAKNKPLFTAQMLGRIENQVEKTWRSINGNIDSFVKGKSVKPGMVKGRPITTLSSLVGTRFISPPKKDETPNEAFSRISNDINKLVADPYMASERLAGITQGLSQFAPEHAEQFTNKAMQQIQFLHDKLPKNPFVGTINEDKWSPSSRDLSEFARYLEAVESPLSVIEKLGQGQISPEGFEVLRTQYSPLYQLIQEQLLLRFEDVKDIPFSKRRILEKALGLPLTTNNKFQTANATQLIQSAHTAQPAEQPRKSKPMNLPNEQLTADRLAF